MDCMKEKFLEGLLLDGRFETISPLNHGSFGMVFMAKDITTGDFVAIKCITKSSVPIACPSATVTDDQPVELACHQRLGSHPNIVNLIGSFQTDSHVYLVLEFCSMGDLYEAIRLGRGPLETEHVRAFMLQLVSAVDFMHSQGYYHRDIKPENIFLAQDGSMKLGDFGLATTDFWSHEASVGSDRYMAPEQYDPAENGYSPAQADIWAIGICLLNILFSRNPFVTPTESDVLFSDYVCDKQSLFDIFPNMSQDTFEVLNHAMAIDPKKRSLTAVRDALQKAVCFTTDDEVLDDFCTDDRAVVPASANREPLRTPSISSPQSDQNGAFPWAKALHMSPPQTVRQLSAIPDTESYTEDLFPASDRDSGSWYSVTAGRSSMASVLESALDASVKSMVFRKPEPRNPPRPDPVPVSGSLPMRTAKPLPALSSIFGKKKDTVSQSWSDLWDEDEEDLNEHESALKQRRVYNSRTWSQESLNEDLTIRRRGLRDLKDTTVMNTRTQSPVHVQVGTSIDGVSENDGFFFQDAGSPAAPRYSPPSKRTIMDKWAALGNRRRAYQANEVTESGKQPVLGNWRRGLGFSMSGNVGGRRDRKDSVGSKVRGWRRNQEFEQKAPCHDGGDLEWVGGWKDLHL
ncbi:serine threonine protein kinase [Lasallia pustulata]|uniref:non-specific serine/threonine protein kinase n=1 Tax=Lasallia pustulata TaxID=136370 RepID=A0A1W5DDP1_9LECA|nr:serine threonine protein kinase [Lasallia pustulata]